MIPHKKEKINGKKLPYAPPGKGEKQFIAG